MRAKGHRKREGQRERERKREKEREREIISAVNHNHGVKYRLYNSSQCSATLNGNKSYCDKGIELVLTPIGNNYVMRYITIMSLYLKNKDAQFKRQLIINVTYA